MNPNQKQAPKYLVLRQLDVQNYLQEQTKALLQTVFNWIENGRANNDEPQVNYLVVPTTSQFYKPMQEHYQKLINDFNSRQIEAAEDFNQKPVLEEEIPGESPISEDSTEEEIQTGDEIPDDNTH